ncbi:Riboflavin biosynthesis protein RibF [Thalassocella blandensis]|nr:Riboflavin biosynthesis protein RibF [Thalassocella blandensis]
MSSEFIHGLSQLVPRHRECVATIGSFDGVHLGHLSVLKQVIASAKELRLPSVAIVFEPQPNEFFAKKAAPARLMRLREKVSALFAAGIDRVLCLKFDQALRSLTAQQYIRQVLVDGLRVRHLVIGDDFRFGCDRSGDFALLVEAGKKYGFRVSDTQTLVDQSIRVSSTRIRELLEQDQLLQAESLLGKPYSVTGRVFYGRQLGSSIGFPTANIGLGRFHSPVSGVYAVLIHTLPRDSGQSSASTVQYHGVANVGVRPTVSGDKKTLLEVHLFDFNGNLYGQCLQVTFKHKIRNEERFPNVEALTQQIQNDAQAARQFFQT